QGTLSHFAEQMRDSLDIAAIPLPGTCKPSQTWKAKRVLPIFAVGEDYQVGAVDMTYTYLGVRQLNGKDHAVIALKGAVRSGGDKSLSGKASGTALVDVATGRVSQENVTVDV